MQTTTMAATAPHSPRGLAARFRADHGALLADIRRAGEDSERQAASRREELMRILRVVARAFLAERLGSAPSEAELDDFLAGLTAE